MIILSDRKVLIEWSQNIQTDLPDDGHREEDFKSIFDWSYFYFGLPLQTLLKTFSQSYFWEISL